MPQALPGALHPSNKNCIDWNNYGAIAYGCHNRIFIVDAFTLRRIQTIEHHNSAVNNVNWAPPSSLSETGVKDGYRLASSDIGGQIVVTEVVSGKKCSQFSYSNTNVLALKWFLWKDASRDFVLALHSGSQLVLWNADSGDKVWSHSYTIPLFDMALDPFNPKHLCFSGPGSSILLVRDLQLGSEPFSNGSHAVLWEDANKASSTQIMQYHNAYRNALFLVISGQTRTTNYIKIFTTIVLFDTELCATLYHLPLEANVVSLTACSLRDAIFTVTQTGSITLRVGTYNSNDDRANAQFGLEKIVNCDTLRHGGQQRVFATALCPATQSTVAVLYSSGRIVFWQVATENSSTDYRKFCITEAIGFDSTLATSAIEPLRLYQSGFLGALSSTVTCVRMRPMDELAKLKEDEYANSPLGAAHLAAVGSQSGILHLIDVFSSQIIKEFNVQTSPIKNLEWGGPYTILTAGYSYALSTTQVVRNDLFITDIRTGASRRIRPEADESPITLMRVSFYHCYLALAFQREPLEIWDLKGLRLLRRMSRTCPLIADMAWSSKHRGVNTTENSGHSVYFENLVVLDSENRLYCVTVKGLHVKDGSIVPTMWKSGGWSIRNMAWKGDILAMGDADGRIAIWDLGKGQSRHIRSSRLPVMRMSFSRLAGDHTLAVLHQRELILWDTEALTKIQSIVVDPTRTALDMDLCGVSPVVITSDNVFQFSPSSRNGPMTDKDVPFLMSETKLEKMIEEFDSGVSEEPYTQWMLSKKQKPTITEHGTDLTTLRNESFLSRFIGDIFSHLLLEVVQSVLADDGSVLLPPELHLFWPNGQFREREMRVACVGCAATTVVESRLVERAVVAGGKAKERVVDRLIGSNDLRYASMKAALLVSSQDNEQAKSLIKLIATNLIASDMIEDGVELLFLVGAGADACKYLQSQKQWNKSVVYAKMGLENPEDILSKWVTHLQHSDKSRFVLAEAARGEWPDVVEHLSSGGRSRLARLILRTTTSSPPATERASPNRSQQP